MRKRNILSHDEANLVLLPHYEAIAKAILDGFDDYLKVRQSVSEGGNYASYKIRTKANIIHDHVESRVRDAFASVEGVKVGEWGGIFALQLNDALFIRFKKLGEGFVPSNSRTNQAINFQNQLTIDGFPDHPTFLYAGYQPDRSWSELRGVSIACWEGDFLHWTHDLLNHQVLTQEILPLYEQEPSERRVKLKNQIQPNTKTGTTD